MKIKNTLTLLASMLIAFAIFACNHSPQAKGKDDKGNEVVTKNKAEDTIATDLAAKLKEIDGAVGKVKADITTNDATWFASDKITAAGVSGLNESVTNNELEAVTGITADTTVKADVLTAVDTAGKNTKKAAAKSSLDELKKIKEYADDAKAKAFLKGHSALKTIIADLLG